MSVRAPADHRHRPVPGGGLGVVVHGQPDDRPGRAAAPGPEPAVSDYAQLASAPTGNAAELFAVVACDLRAVPAGLRLAPPPPGRCVMRRRPSHPRPEAHRVGGCRRPAAGSRSRPWRPRARHRRGIRGVRVLERAARQLHGRVGLRLDRQPDDLPGRAVDRGERVQRHRATTPHPARPASRSCCPARTRSPRTGPTRPCRSAGAWPTSMTATARRAPPGPSSGPTSRTGIKPRPEGGP